jgi:hypothetical protein
MAKKDLVRNTKPCKFNLQGFVSYYFVILNSFQNLKREAETSSA